MAKVNHQENICFIKENNIHPMHIAIRPIAKAFEKLKESFLKTKYSLITLKLPWKTLRLQKLEEQCNTLLQNTAHICTKKEG